LKPHESRDAVIAVDDVIARFERKKRVFRATTRKRASTATHRRAMEKFRSRRDEHRGFGVLQGSRTPTRTTAIAEIAHRRNPVRMRARFKNEPTRQREYGPLESIDCAVSCKQLRDPRTLAI
jgi:hypothetical protein